MAADIGHPIYQNSLSEYFSKVFHQSTAAEKPSIRSNYRKYLTCLFCTCPEKQTQNLPLSDELSTN